MIKLMFLCTGNSCRSQMAEGLAGELGRGLIEARSAGVRPAGTVQPRAVLVMQELGIDITRQTSKPIDESLLKTMDIIITLCSDADKSCPKTPPEIRRLHWPIDDPSGIRGTEQEIMDAFRTARDRIREKIAELIEDIKSNPEAVIKTTNTFTLTQGTGDKKND